MSNKKIKNPLWDNELNIEKRLDFLINSLTLDEKISCMSNANPDIDRLGIRAFNIGGEGAHGVQARHDQGWDLREPDFTTIFPNPIGMSRSWDEDMLKKSGEVVGIETRGLFAAGKRGSLSVWAPTVDMERDPRWGRNEEAYGEDPYLTGSLAGAYVEGMQGDDDFYLRCAATLKHFYANNVEEDRTFTSSSIDPRNKHEYYHEPFRRIIKEHGAEAMMTAYNEINGVPCMVMRDIKDYAKDRWGLHHVVTDGGDVLQTVNQHEYFGTDAQTVAAGIKAGVDSFSDNREKMEDAVREAYALGLIEMKDIDEAVRNRFGTMIRLGLFDAYGDNPYSQITIEDVSTKKNQETALKMGQESVVLLENKNGLLPIDKRDAIGNIGVIGPLADVWQLDWYSGLPPYYVTGLDGIKKYTDTSFEKGLCRFKIKADGKYLGLDKEDRLVIVDEKNAEIFEVEQWDKKQFTLKSCSKGKFLSVRDDINGGESGDICACKERAFGWFVKEAFKISESDGELSKKEAEETKVSQNENRQIIFNSSVSCGVTSWNDETLYIDENGKLCVESALQKTEKCDYGNNDEVVEESMSQKMSANEENRNEIDKSVKISHFEFELVSDGIEKAVKLAKKVKYPILFLGGDPMITCKEDVDREDIDFPAYQQELLEAVYEANQNVIIVLISNVAFDISWAKEHIKSILLSASGCMELGTAIADNIFGKVSPAGRLSTTWYKELAKLPPKEDYDIIAHPRTYAYYDDEVLYPFGYGKTYSEVRYLDMTAEIKDYTKIAVTVEVENTGKYVTDEVVQIYVTKKGSAVKRAIRELKAFERVKELASGERRTVRLEIKIGDLKYYDVADERFILEDGEYEIQAGSSSRDIYLKRAVNIKGTARSSRDAWQTIKANHYDKYENIYLYEGINGFDAVCTLDNKTDGEISYRNVCVKKACSFKPEKYSLEILASIEDDGVVEAFANDEKIGCFVKGQTKTTDIHSEIGTAAFRTDKKMPWAAFGRKTDFKKYDIELDGNKIPDGEFELKLKMRGYIRVCSFKMI